YPPRYLRTVLVELKEHKVVTFRTVRKLPTGQNRDVPLPMTAAEIATDLTERIRRREYAPGTQLPTYAALAALYSVSESTITNVIRLLRDRGVVVGIPGRGTFVPEDDSKR